VSEPAAIGVDIGGTNLRVALVTREGELLLTHREVLRGRSVSEVTAQLETALGALPPSASSLPIGVAIAAMLRRDGFVRVAPNLGWSDLDLRGQLEQSLGTPIALLNDLDAAVLAEARMGAGVD